jgi:hypothetical protein
MEENYMKWTMALTIVLCVATLGLNSASAQTRYELICHGGAGYHLDIYKGTSTRFGPNAPILNNYVILWFNKGTKPVVQGLNPGECTWADRGMRSEEPGALCMENVALMVGLQTNGTGIWSFSHLQVHPTNPDQVRRALEGLESSTEYQTFWVYNDFKGCMRF